MQSSNLDSFSQVVEVVNHNYEASYQLRYATSSHFLQSLLITYLVLSHLICCMVNYSVDPFSKQ